MRIVSSHADDGDSFTVTGLQLFWVVAVMGVIGALALAIAGELHF
jgi:hypothetical protein